jgi:hypothetical protein
VFTPKTSGPHSGSLIVESDDMQNPVLTIPLFGTGADFLISLVRPSRPSRQDLNAADLQLYPNQPQTIQLDVSASAALESDVHISCSGLPENVSCTAAPSSLHFDGRSTQTVAITFLVAEQQAGNRTNPALWFVALLTIPLGMFVRPNDRRSNVVRLLILCLVLPPILSCGSSIQRTTTDTVSTNLGSSFTATITAQTENIKRDFQMKIQVLSQ